VAYNYMTERPKIFTEDGQVIFLKVRDNTHRLLRLSGACRADEMMNCAGGDTWTQYACIDRLVELGEIREIFQNKCAGQHRIFVSTKDC